MKALMDLIGLYNYYPEVLDDFTLPESLVPKKDDIITNLLLETAEREVIYTNPGFLKMAIGAWSKKQSPIWGELYATTQYEYNPIWNVDGKVVETRDLAATEDITTNVDRTDDLTDKRTADLQDKRTADLQDKRTADLQDKRTADLQDKRTADLTEERTLDLATTDDATTDEYVYGYNSATKAPSKQTVLDDDTTSTGTDTLDTTGTDTMDHTGTDTMDHTGTDTMDHTGTDTMDHTGTDTMEHTGTQDIDTTVDKDTTDTGTVTTERTGNIGVTSTQSLIQEQRDVVKFNIVDYIIEDFANRFCLKVY